MTICSGTVGVLHGHAEIVYEETQNRQCPFCSAKDEWDEEEARLNKNVSDLEREIYELRRDSLKSIQPREDAP